jgi:hypothetical protein
VGDLIGWDSVVLDSYTSFERMRSFRRKDTATTKIINEATKANTTVSTTRIEYVISHIARMNTE